MAEPLIVVTHARVKEGSGDDVAKYVQQIQEIVHSNEPRVIAFVGFFSEDGTEMTSIQVHPDAASLEFHMQVLRDKWDASFSKYAGMLEITSIEYYGTPPQDALQMDRELGIRVNLNRYLAGFARASANLRTAEAQP